MFIAFLTTSILRGVGDSITPLIFQGIGVVLAAILDPLLMLGWCGFPRLGLNGTAYSMLITQSLTLVAFFIYLHKKNHIASPDWRHLAIDWQTSKLTLKIGLPAAAQQLLVALGSSFMLRFVNDYHESAAAGFGAASQIDMLAFFLAISFSIAISSLSGQNIGAGRYDRVQQTFRYGLLFSGGLSLCLSLAVISWPAFFVRIFLDPAQSPEAFRIGVGYLHIVGISYTITAVMFVCVGIINGAGHTLMTTLMTLLGLWIVRVPLAAFLSHRLHRVEGIWYALVVSFTVSTLFSLGYYFSGRWRCAIIRHSPQHNDEIVEEEMDLSCSPR